MNTADRSIALVDLALRRRFAFVDFTMREEPVKGLLRRWLAANDLGEMDWVADVVERANEKLDDHHAAIGPSYFMRKRLDEVAVERIWKHSVLPYVEEHLYGERDKLSRVRVRQAPRRGRAGRREAGGWQRHSGTRRRQRCGRLTFASTSRVVRSRSPWTNGTRWLGEILASLLCRPTAGRTSTR